MKKIDVVYNLYGYIDEVSDNSIHFEQENDSLKINATIETNKKVRAYIKAPNNNSNVTDEITSENNVYSFTLDGNYMAKGTLYVGYELYDDTGYIERLEPLKIYIDSFVSLDSSNSENVYVVTVKIGEVEALESGENATVENVGTKKDLVLNFGIPRGDKGEQGIQGIPGNDGYTPIKGVDYFTEEDIKSLGIPKTLSNLTDDITEQTYNKTSEKPQSGKAVAEAIAKLLGSAPENLDTLEELAKALNEDENFSATVLAEIAKKVDKEEGKELSSNDFTTTLLNKLNGIDANATSSPEVIHFEFDNEYDERINTWRDKSIFNQYNDGFYYITMSYPYADGAGGYSEFVLLICNSYEGPTSILTDRFLITRYGDIYTINEDSSVIGDEWEKISVSQTDLNNAIGDVETSLKNIIKKYGLGGEGI